MAFVEDFYNILEEIHCQEKGHIGEKKTVIEVSTIRFCADLCYYYYSVQFVYRWQSCMSV